MTDNKEKERALAEAVTNWIEIYHPEEESYPAIERAAIVVGFDAGLATATTEIQELKSELALLKSMVDAADRLIGCRDDGGPGLAYWQIEQMSDGTWMLDDDACPIKKRFDSPTEAFAAIGGK